jgi:DNA invertase Pin-like site-specific DNA recombinase
MKTLTDRLHSANQSIEYECNNERTSRDTRPGQATEYIDQLRRIVRKAARSGVQTLLVVIYCRVSSDKQRRYGNLDHQLADVRRLVHRLGERYGIEIEILDEFGEEVSAWRLWKSGRSELVKAAKLASEKDAVLVGLNTSKFVRNRHYWRKGTLPTVDDFDQLMALVGKVRLATILPPDQHEDRSSDTIRGHKARGANPGRSKKRTKEQRKRLTRWLHGRGWVIRDIAAKRMVGASKSTVGRWINE